MTNYYSFLFGGYYDREKQYHAQAWSPQINETSRAGNPRMKMLGLPARNGDSPLKYYLQSFSKFHVFYLGRLAEEFAASHSKELVCRVRYASGSIVLWA